MTTTAQTLTLRTALDTYGHTKAIKDGRLRSERLQLDFVDVNPMNRAFAPMAERQEFDFSEMAIVTFLQALSFGKPILLLPVVMLNRFHHGSIVHNVARPIESPRHLNGKRIGVRAYTQTTGVWVRGIFHAEYGLDLDSITSVTTEGGHLSEYVEPKNVVRAPKGASLKEMLLAGEIDAWIAGRDAPKIAEIAPIVPNADAAALEWFERVKAFPINHMAVVAKSVVDANPWLPAELFGLLKRGKELYLKELASMPSSSEGDEEFKRRVYAEGIDPLPFGVEALRRSLDVVIDYAFAQHLIPRRYAVDDLFDPRLRTLA